MKKTFMILTLLITASQNQYGALFAKARITSCARVVLLKLTPLTPRCQFTSMIMPIKRLAATSLTNKVKIQTHSKRDKSSYSEIWVEQTMLQSMPHNQKSEGVSNIFTKQEVTEHLLNRHMRAMDNFMGSYFNFPQLVLAADHQLVVNRMMYWQSKKHQLFTIAKTVKRTIEQEKELHKKYEQLEDGYEKLKLYIPQEKLNEMECKALSDLSHEERDHKAFLEGSLGVQK